MQGLLAFIGSYLIYLGHLSCFLRNRCLPSAQSFASYSIEATLFSSKTQLYLEKNLDHVVSGYNFTSNSRGKLFCCMMWSQRDGQVQRFCEILLVATPFGYPAGR